MLRTIRHAATIAVSVTALSVVAIPANATIIAMGDITPALSLTNAAPNSATPGNQQFFSNVLGSGTQVVVQDSIGNLFVGPEISSFYSGLTGVSSTLLASGAAITATNLAGVDLLITPTPQDAFSGAEIAAISALIAGGGTYFVLDEELSGGFANSNAALAALGSALMISGPFFDVGSQTSTGSEIAAHPLTAGVASFNYGAAHQISGGTSLFFSNGGTPYAQVEGFTSTSIFEPGTLGIFSLGLVALGFARRKWMN